jgi:predicted dehydrogenase
VQLSLTGGRGDDKEMKPLDVPADLRAGWPDDVVPGNVARVYAQMAADLRDGTRTAPTFDDAVRVHRIIAAIEASGDGRRLALG